MVRLLIPIVCSLLLIAACGSAESATEAPPTATESPTATHSPEPTEAPPTDTPLPVTVNPVAAIELVGGAEGTCVNEDETQSTVIGFPVIYYNTTTENLMTAELTTPDGEVIGSLDTNAENNDGEGGWGMYPLAYTVPDNTPLTIVITVYSGSTDDTPISSVTSLTYDCTTGEALDSSFDYRGG